MTQNAEKGLLGTGPSPEDSAAGGKSAATVAHTSDRTQQGLHTVETAPLSVRPVLVTQTGRKIPDLTGETFGLLTAVAYAGHNTAHRVTWDCVCECGEKVTVRWDHLRDGGTQSCGCLVRRRMSHLNRTHGKSKTPLYGVWRGMIQRCEDANSPHFKYYGGRGIAVCIEWRSSFEAFEQDMGAGYRPGLSIDRVDNDRGYSASNCRWATDTQQSRNRRFNRLLTFEGETHCVTEWAELIGIKSTTLSERLRRGWPPERALTQDVLQPRRGGDRGRAPDRRSA